VVIAPYDFVIDAGGDLRSIVVLAEDEERVKALLGELMPRTELTVFAGRGGRTDLFSTRGASSITGAGSLFVPTLLAALIVFNTMLGSIYERTGEIGILSSIGLAPPGLQLNYSSSATVLLAMFIMVVVVGSSVYPALQARRIAVPGVEARWQLPEAVGNTITIELPFTVGRETALGINAYLEEYFQAHTEAALGGFTAEGVELEPVADRRSPGLRLTMVAWLAPYDVGVSQRVVLKTRRLPEDMFYGITLRLERLSGDEGSWRRLNRHFTDLVRKQFLIWRVLRPEGRNAYAQRTAERFGEAV